MFTNRKEKITKKPNKRKKYGLTEEDVNRMLLEQTNKCYTCKTSFEGKTRANIDHCHKSGKVRGILCFQCNASLGLLKENIETLKNLIKYLQK